jgi:hypothetical protein
MATLPTAKAQVESFPSPTQVYPVTRKATLCGDPPIDRSFAARKFTHLWPAEVAGNASGFHESGRTWNFSYGQKLDL